MRPSAAAVKPLFLHSFPTAMSTPSKPRIDWGNAKLAEDAWAYFIAESDTGDGLKNDATEKRRRFIRENQFFQAMVPQRFKNDDALVRGCDNALRSYLGRLKNSLSATGLTGVARGPPLPGRNSKGHFSGVAGAPAAAARCRRPWPCTPPTSLTTRAFHFACCRSWPWPQGSQADRAKGSPRHVPVVGGWRVAAFEPPLSCSRP